MNVEMRTWVDEKQAALFCDMAENKGVSCSEALKRFVDACVQTGDFPFPTEPQDAIAYEAFESEEEASEFASVYARRELA